jgi:hypothetical protein
MAPNRKTNVDVVDSLATLAVQDFVNPKFLPLTHPEEKKTQEEYGKQEQNQETSAVVHAPHSFDAAHPVHSYWDWPATKESSNGQAETVRTILEEETIRQTLSANHMEETLKNAAADASYDPSNMVYVKSTSTQEEDHWYMPSEETVEEKENENNVTDLAHDSYWNWSTPTEQEQRSQLIDQIKQEDAIRCMFSVDHIQQLLVQQAAAMASAVDSDAALDKAENDSYWDWTPETTCASHVSDPQHANNAYWDWPAPLESAQQKTEMIHEIFREEAIRQGMSMDHIEAQLVQQAAIAGRTTRPPDVATTSSGSNASYWDW